MKKFISLFLVFSILLLSGNMFARKKGAELYIQMKYGYYERGELIAVKQNSILILDRYSGADVTVDIRNIRAIKIVRESETLVGGIIGLFLGGVIGYLIGYPQGDEAGFVIIGRPLIAAAILGGVSGALFGAGIGTAVGADKTVQIEGKSDSEIKEILEKLRKKARVKNAQ